MPVLEVTTAQRILGDHIYVLPPDKFMEIQDDSLRLVQRPNTLRNGAIDYFLFSLAEDQARGPSGEILSGEGSDGAEGLNILKEKGGMTMAQTPATASSRSMPTKAIEIDHVGCVLSPREIAQQLGSREWCDSHIVKNPLRVLWSSAQQPSGSQMNTGQSTRDASAETPYASLSAICARAGLDLERVDPSILARMRLLAATTETLRDCERCTELAEAFFRYDDASNAPRMLQRAGAPERRDRHAVLRHRQDRPRPRG